MPRETATLSRALTDTCNGVAIANWCNGHGRVGKTTQPGGCICLCLGGYTGARCQNPPANSIIERSYIVNSGLAALGLIATILSRFMTKGRYAQHTVPLQTALALCDIYTDIELTTRMYAAGHALRAYFWWFAASLLASMLANFGIMYYVFSGETRSNVLFGHWRVQHASFFNGLQWMSCLDMQVIYLINSRVFDLGVTTANLSYDAQRLLNMATYISLLIENIPQLILQIMIWCKNEANALGANIYFAVALSIFDILSAVMGLLYARQMLSAEEMTDEQRQTLSSYGLQMRLLSDETTAYHQDKTSSSASHHRVSMQELVSSRAEGEEVLTPGATMMKIRQLEAGSRRIIVDNSSGGDYVPSEQSVRSPRFSVDEMEYRRRKLTLQDDSYSEREERHGGSAE